MNPRPNSDVPEAVPALWRDDALARVVTFARCFGEPHAVLALHAAVPLGLTPELLHLIRINFVRQAPRVAEADLLLSPLCEDIGGGFYQMPADVRDLLLDELCDDPAFGLRRLEAVAEFLLAYVEHTRGAARDEDRRAYLLAQEWTALAYLDPAGAAEELAAALADALRPGPARRGGDVLRVASVAEALARPLAGEEKVLLYAVGVERLAAGDTRMARRIFDALGPRDQPTVIGAVAMPAAAALLAGESDEFVNSLGMKFVLIPPGTFLMGSPPEEEGRLIDEGPVHEVEITQPYYLGVYQVTQAEYERVMGMNPSWFSSSGQGKDQVKGQDTRRFPVEFVSWEDAVEFCRKLSEMPEEKKHGRTYRLPTEAEWEYSCRGGASDSKPFYFKDGPTSWLSSTQANFEGNYPYGGAAKGPYLARPTPVGSYQPNAFGLFDMHGNVWEWCADWFDNKYYEKSPKKDPQGPEKGKRRVLRGGSWSLIGWLCRAAYRTSLEPGNRGDFIGFRVLLFAGARTS